MDVTRPRVLVTYGSKHGGTAGIAESIGAELRASDLDVEVADPARSTRWTGMTRS